MQSLFIFSSPTNLSGSGSLNTETPITAKEIVDRYAGQPGDKLLPFQSQEKYNRNIKIIFEKAGITYLVTTLNTRTRKEEKVPINEIASSHMARRTFIGNIYKLVKDPNLVSALTGHVEGSRAFARYRDINDDMLTDLVSKLNKKCRFSGKILNFFIDFARKSKTFDSFVEKITI